MRNRILSTVAVLALSAAPAWATSVDLYGSHWNTDEADAAFGGGVTWVPASKHTLGVELRASYYEELASEPLDGVFDEDPVFEDGLRATPLEGGLRVNLRDSDVNVRPYLAGGAGYYFLDSDFGDVDDEYGWYGAVGSSFGNGTGAEFFAEANYRGVKGTVEVDPEEFDDLDDVEFDGGADIDLSGVGVNVGLNWRW
jgi:hypothetical protein